ncbi:CBS domain-containing protein [Ilyomonas limi]|uniref:CBS domain-containing protein n=1 Tax=Ilyomonas limi TaxID=2575867 RepID=A0A4U3L6S7_9BACT|nr:CBS domain-containing protein [Ilyomonas limi]TKK69327.1 CBS domain-containing protein [Ilyomonas limi]
MNRVQQVLSRKGTNAVAVSPDTSVYEALKVMAEKNIGSVVIMQGDTFLGIVTERDYSRKVILQNKHSDTTLVSEIMTADLPRVSPEDTIDHCMGLMTSNNIRYLPVFDNDRLAGIISMSDVVKDTILTQQQTINHLNEYLYS